MRNMNASPYYDPAEAASGNGGSNPPVQQPANGQKPAPGPPVNVLSAVPRKGFWEFTLSNKTKWTAPSTVQAFAAPQYGEAVTFGIIPRTFTYHRFGGNLAQAWVTYSVTYGKQTYSVMKAATQAP
jgi:hypothetical protein